MALVEEGAFATDGFALAVEYTTRLLRLSAASRDLRWSASRYLFSEVAFSLWSRKDQGKRG
jgi:hypothetical protein